MTRQARTMRNSRKVRAAFLLAAMSCVLGLFFCLVKSPQARSEAWLSVAMEAANQRKIDNAVIAASHAVRLDPSSRRGWMLLSSLLHQDGQEQASRQATNIAIALQQSAMQKNPLYAMPAELKLSLLAETGTDIR